MITEADFDAVPEAPPMAGITIGEMVDYVTAAVAESVQPAPVTGRVEVLEMQVAQLTEMVRALLHHVCTDEALRLSEDARLMIGEYEQAMVPKL